MSWRLCLIAMVTLIHFSTVLLSTLAVRYYYGRMKVIDFAFFVHLGCCPGDQATTSSSFFRYDIHSSYLLASVRRPLPTRLVK